MSDTKSIQVNDVLWCPNCHELHEIKGDISFNLGGYNVYVNPQDILCNIECKICKAFLIPLDKEMSEDIDLLNKKGYHTLFSCAGHGIDDPNAYVVFDENTSKILLDKKIEAPKRWWLDIDPLNTPNDTIKIIKVVVVRSTSCLIWSEKLYKLLNMDYDTLHKEELDGFKEWVKSLPDINEEYDKLSK